ncbi:MAG: hypothetical protein II730_06370 [Bacteroidales bacterium]|nr:hypothetical protein [Bacteroidales bacterium]
MEFDIQLPLPEGWVSSVDQYIDEDGSEISHLEAQLRGRGIDLYVGPMPEGETAADQAFSNYVDMVGFEDGDEGDPIIQYPFDGKKAYGFEAYDEEDHPLRVLCLEPKKGILAVMCLSAADERSLSELQTLVERKLRIKKA